MNKTIRVGSTVIFLVLLLTSLFDGFMASGTSFEGEEEEDPTDIGDGSCPCPRTEANYEPVCGTNNKTYGNTCLLECDKDKGVECKCMEECPCPYPVPAARQCPKPEPRKTSN